MIPRGKRSIRGQAMRVLVGTLASGIVVLGPCTDRLPARQPVIAVLVSHQAEPYVHALAGFERVLRERRPGTEVRVFQIEGDAARAETVLAEALDGSPSLLVTVGSLATNLVVAEVDHVPVVAGLVLRSDSFGGKPNVTGVTLEHPFEVQLKVLLQIIPGCRRVGVLYDPKENESQELAVARAATGLGLKIEATRIEGPQDLPEALDSLATRADVLLTIPNRIVLTPQVSKQMLLFSFRNHIPLAGVSDVWVKAGALYSLDWDYEDLGAQCGEMAIQVLAGTPVRGIPPAGPRQVRYGLNLRTAELLGAALADSVVKGAKATY